MDKYEKHIAKSKNTVMIHVSLDRDKESAEKWAADAKLPWFHILPKDVNKSKLKEQFKKTRYVPEYNLINNKGEIIASDADNCFDKIKKLSKD